MFFKLFKSFSIVQTTKLKLISPSVPQRADLPLHHDALNWKGLERARDFVPLPTADALVRARIWSGIGLPPSRALPSSRLTGISYTLLKHVCCGLRLGLRTWTVVWEPPALTDWENLTLHWEKLRKRQTALYRHSWGTHGKEEWGQKPSRTPEDLI